MYLFISRSDFPRVSVGPYNPLMVEEGDTAAMLCEVSTAEIRENCMDVILSHSQRSFL